MIYNIEELPTIENGDLIIPTSLSKSAFRQNLTGFRLLFELLDVLTHRYYWEGEYGTLKTDWSKYSEICNPGFIRNYKRQLISNESNEEYCDWLLEKSKAIYGIDVPVNRINKLFKDLDELKDFLKTNNCKVGVRDNEYKDFAFPHWLFGWIIEPTFDPFQAQAVDYNFIVTPNPDHVRFLYYPYYNVPLDTNDLSCYAFCWLSSCKEASIVRKSDVMNMRNHYAIKLYLLISTLEYNKVYTWQIPDFMAFLGAMYYDIEEQEVVNGEDIEGEEDFIKRIFPKAVDYLNNFRNPRTNKPLNFTLYHLFTAWDVSFCIKSKGSASPFPNDGPGKTSKRGRKPKEESDTLEITQEKIDEVKDRLRRRKYKRDIHEAAIEQLKEEGVLIKETPREYIPRKIRDYVWTRDGGRCVYCGSKENLAFDHIIPVAQGGDTTAENLQILCRNCNLEKRDHIGEL